MPRRNLDPHAFFEKRALQHQPRQAFTGKTRAQFQAWKKSTLPAVLATLGQIPQAVPPKPELMVRWEEDGLIKERWLLDTQPGLSAVVLIFRPANLHRGEKRPALLCCHGHGPHGKDSVMGLATSAEREQTIRKTNYSYGLQMAKAGFVTYSLDWLGFGERSSRGKPFFFQTTDGRDPCNIHFLCATMLGTTVLGMNCHDARVVTDFVCRQSYVDPQRLGVMGLSLGGTMTTWTALYDKRFLAVDIMCYAGPFYDIAYRTYNVCGSQVTPGLFDLVDVPDLQGLIAPRPLLVEIGIYDECFQVDHTLPLNYRQLQRVYQAAGATDRLELDLFPGNHAWGANKSIPFFRRHLQADWPQE